MAWYFIAFFFFFSFFPVTFVRNSGNSPFKHVGSFSQNKCKPKTQHSRKVMKPRIGETLELPVILFLGRLPCLFANLTFTFLCFRLETKTFVPFNLSALG